MEQTESSHHVPVRNGFRLREKMDVEDRNLSKRISEGIRLWNGIPSNSTIPEIVKCVGFIEKVTRRSDVLDAADRTPRFFGEAERANKNFPT
jgi:hypothetical protein